MDEDRNQAHKQPKHRREDMKCVYVERTLHKEVTLRAIRSDTTIQDLVAGLLQKYVDENPMYMGRRPPEAEQTTIPGTVEVDSKPE